MSLCLSAACCSSAAPSTLSSFDSCSAAAAPSGVNPSAACCCHCCCCCWSSGWCWSPAAAWSSAAACLTFDGGLQRNQIQPKCVKPKMCQTNSMCLGESLKPICLSIHPPYMFMIYASTHMQTPCSSSVSFAIWVLSADMHTTKTTEDT
jgi:hypothetical protein